MAGKKYKWVPVIEEFRCNGCQACVLACGPKCLEIVDHVAVLIKPDICGSEEHCIAPCPIAAIHMEWVEMDENMDWDMQRGKWRFEKENRRYETKHKNSDGKFDQGGAGKDTV